MERQKKPDSLAVPTWNLATLSRVGAGRVSDLGSGLGFRV